MRRVLPWILILLIWIPASHAQSVPLTVLAGRGGTGGCPTFDVGPGGATFFLDPVKTPVGVAVDQNGKLFVATGANCVFRLDADGLLRVGFPGGSGPFRIGTGAAGFADGDAAAALLSNPQHLALDASGNLYVADSNNGRIRKVDVTHWTITTVAGGGPLRPNDGVLATQASFLFVTSVAVDRNGNLFIVDSNAGKVYKVDTNGILTRFAGFGGFTYNGEGIPALSAGMIPMDVEVDASGNVFIADWSNSIVRKVTPDGLMNTVAGNPFNVTGLGDGQPAAFGGILNKPRGIALDGYGNLFIADTNNHRIRKVDASGIITTVAGNGTPGALDTQLNLPYDVAVDNLGNIFVADTLNNELRGVIVSERTYALTLNASGTGSGSVSGTGSYIVGQAATVSATAAAGSSFVNWTGPNAAECAAGTVVMNGDKSCTANFIAAKDTTSPVLSNVPDSVKLVTSSPTGVVATFGLPTATDPDDAAGPVTCTPASGSLFPIGTTTVTCSSTDAHGNTGSASFTVTVSLADVVIAVNASITVTDDTAGIGALPDGAIVVNESITVTDDTAGLGTLPNGAIVVNESVTVTDGTSGLGAPPDGAIVVNESVTVSDSATATVPPDTTPPVLTLPLAITVDATSPSGATVTFTASANDAVSGAVAVSCSPSSGSTFAIGTTVVGCVAQDAAANTVRRSFPVTVLGPSQIIGNLIAALGASFTQGVSLLQNASKALASGNTLSACGQVDAFIKQVSAQTGKSLTTAQAAHLLAIAADIRAAAGCQ